VRGLHLLSGLPARSINPRRRHPARRWADPLNGFVEGGESATLSAPRPSSPADIVDRGIMLAGAALWCAASVI